MASGRDGGVRERIEKLGAAGLAALPDRVARVLAGRPIRIDGQQLDVHVQLALRVSALTGTGVFQARAVEVERAATRADARAVAGRRIELAKVTQLRVDGGEQDDRGSPLHAPRGWWPRRR